MKHEPRPHNCSGLYQSANSYWIRRGCAATKRRCRPGHAKDVALLSFLVQNARRRIDKSEILDAVWGGTFVELGNLAVTISHVRRTFGDSAQNPFTSKLYRLGDICSSPRLLKNRTSSSKRCANVCPLRRRVREKILLRRYRSFFGSASRCSPSSGFGERNAM
jgi:hypothetical protein